MKTNIPILDYPSDVAIAKFKDMIPEALNSILCCDTGNLQMILDSTAPLTKEIIKQMV